MIKLYRTKNEPVGKNIENQLKELLVAHQVIILESNQLSLDLPPNTPLPAIKENEKVVIGQFAIEMFLKELEKDTRRWSWLQTDACYIDEDGENC